MATTTSDPTLPTAPDWQSQKNKAYDAWMAALEAARLQRTGTFQNYGLSEANQPQFADIVAAIESGKPIPTGGNIRWNADPSGQIQQMFSGQGGAVQTLANRLAARGIHGGLANNARMQLQNAQQLDTLNAGKKMLADLLQPQNQVSTAYGTYQGAISGIDNAHAQWDALYNYLHPPNPADKQHSITGSKPGTTGLGLVDHPTIPRDQGRVPTTNPLTYRPPKPKPPRRPKPGQHSMGPIHYN